MGEKVGGGIMRSKTPSYDSLSAEYRSHGQSLDVELLSDRSRRLFGVVVAAAVLFHPRTARTDRRTRFRRSPAAPRPPNPQIKNH